MARLLGGLTRHVVGDRRNNRRQRIKYDTVVRDEGGNEVFHGYTVDVSRTGTKLRGFPSRTGVFEGQNITVEFLLVPKEVDKIAQRVPVAAYVVRVEEREDEYVLAVTFKRPMAE